MKMIAYLLAIICAIAAVMYFVMPAGSLPTFMPGYAAGSTHIHMTHAIAAGVAAVVLFVIGWFSAGASRARGASAFRPAPCAAPVRRSARR